MLVIFYGELKIGHQKMGSLSGLAPSLRPGLDSTLQINVMSKQTDVSKQMTKNLIGTPPIPSGFIAETVTFHTHPIK